MAYRYLSLGSGMQGTASAYYFSQFGDAKQITMADRDLGVAKKAADRVNTLAKKEIAEAVQVDASNAQDLIALMKKHDAVMSAIDYALNLKITECALEADVHLADLGGNTDVVNSQHTLGKKKGAKNASLIPDCGLAPGLGNSMGAYLLEEVEGCEDIQVRCGGLPQNPKPPLDYKLVFNVRGLTNEYFGKAWVLRDSKIQEIDTFTELEDLEFKAPVGKCEAFVTTGGTSTSPWTFQSKLKNYGYKTVRYPGHFDKIKCMMDLGLLDLDPVQVGDVKVVPRELFHTVVPPRIAFPDDKDLVVIRAEGKNTTGKGLRLEMILFQDEKTGFTAMEMGTGYPAALALIYAARGEAKKGVVSLETAFDNKKYMEELMKNGLPIEKSTI